MAKERVTFEVGGDRVVGDLHRPEGATGTGAGVVVAGPMTSVKEQVTGVYAAALAARGIAALAIDHRHYGESGGQPRQYEHAPGKIEDLRAALAFLAGRGGGIDPARLGLVGVCLGAGYAAWAAVDNPLVQAFAAVAGYYRDPDAMRAGDPDGFAARVAQGRAARERYESAGEVVTIPAVATDGDAAMTTPELVDYYGTPRAGVPNYVNAFAVMSREHFLPFDVQAAAPRLAAPTLMIHAENALSPGWARKFHGALAAARKEIAWVDAPGQTAFYDDPALVAGCADRLAAHLDARDRRA